MFLDGAVTTRLLKTYSSPQKAVAGSYFTFQWTYEVADANKPDFGGITWGLTPSSVFQTLVFVSPSGIVDASKAPARYKGRITWTGDVSKSVASFLLSNVTSGDEEEYGIKVDFGPFLTLTDSVVLKVLGKCSTYCR